MVRCKHKNYSELARPGWAKCNDCGLDFRQKEESWVEYSEEIEERQGLP